MKKQSFILSAIILAFGGIFAKAIGALYKIPLANILGSSGMGIYYLIFPLYSLIITLCSSGLAVALATGVAKCRKIRHRYNEQKLLQVSLIISFLMSVVFMTLILFFAKYIAELQGNVNGYKGYIIIAPAIIISSLIATLRGYFQGIENMIPTTVSLIVEQIVKLSVGLILAHFLCKHGIEYAVIGAILGVTISEVIAFIIIVINFIVYKGQMHYNYRNLVYRKKKAYNPLIFIKKNKKVHKRKYVAGRYFKCNTITHRYTNKEAIIILSKVAMPATLSNLIIPLSSMIDSFVIINLMVKSGYSTLISTSLYGLWGGVVQSLISLPTIIIAGISTALVPSLSSLSVQDDGNEIKNRVAFFIKLTWLLGLLMFLLMYSFSEEILKFLYGGGLSSDVIDEMFYAIKMLQYSSVSIIYYAFLQTFTSILQALGKSHIPFISMAIGLIIRVLLINVLVSNSGINIFGGVIANTIFVALSCVCCAWYISKKIPFEYNFYRHLFLPIVISGILLGIIMALDWILEGVINYFFAMIISGIIGIIVFVFVCYYFKVFTRREMKYFKIYQKSITKKRKNRV